MPRTKIGDYAKSLNRKPVIELILGRMAVSNTPRRDIAKVIGLSEAQFNFRIRNWDEGKWPFGDLVKICKSLGVQREEFLEKIRF